MQNASLVLQVLDIWTKRPKTCSNTTGPCTRPDKDIHTSDDVVNTGQRGINLKLAVIDRRQNTVNHSLLHMVLISVHHNI